MKKSIAAMVLAVIIGASPAIAQNPQKDVEKQRREQVKLGHKRLSEKASKDARKEAKALRKAGWLTPAGALPIDKQLDEAYLKQTELNNVGEKAWLMGSATAIGESLDAATFSALEMAKINLVQVMEQQIAGKTETRLGNARAKAAVSKAITEGEFRTIYSQKIAGVEPVLCLYREKVNGDYEVQVRLFYSRAKAEEVTKEALRDQLLKDGIQVDDEDLEIISCPIVTDPEE